MTKTCEICGEPTQRTREIFWKAVWLDVGRCCDGKDWWPRERE